MTLVVILDEEYCTIEGRHVGCSLELVKRAQVTADNTARGCARLNCPPAFSEVGFRLSWSRNPHTSEGCRSWSWTRVPTFLQRTARLIRTQPTTEPPPMPLGLARKDSPTWSVSPP